MSFFKKLKKAVSKVTKLAVKTAPIWSSFVPGGSIAEKLISKGGALGKIGRGVQAVQKVRGRLQAVQARAAAHAHPAVQRLRQVQARHVPVRGMTQRVRAARHVVPGRMPTTHPTAWARNATTLPANPFLNGRFTLTHGRRLAMSHRVAPSGVMSRRRIPGYRVSA